MKYILILCLAFFAAFESCVMDERKNFYNQQSIDLVWKTKASLKENGYIFTMYFFNNNDTVNLISDDVLLRLPYQFRKDSLILGHKSFLLKRYDNEFIDLYENGNYHTTVEGCQLIEVIWDSYKFNQGFYSSNKNQELKIEELVPIEQK